jgi:hypothetical protein
MSYVVDTVLLPYIKPNSMQICANKLYTPEAVLLLAQSSLDPNPTRHFFLAPAAPISLLFPSLPFTRPARPLSVSQYGLAPSNMWLAGGSERSRLG